MPLTARERHLIIANLVHLAVAQKARHHHPQPHRRIRRIPLAAHPIHPPVPLLIPRYPYRQRRARILDAHLPLRRREIRRLAHRLAHQKLNRPFVQITAPEPRLIAAARHRLHAAQRHQLIPYPLQPRRNARLAAERPNRAYPLFHIQPHADILKVRVHWHKLQTPPKPLDRLNRAHSPGGLRCNHNSRLHFNIYAFRLSE